MQKQTFSVQWLNSLETANPRQHHSYILIYTIPCHQPPITKIRNNNIYITYSIDSVSHTT